MRPSNNIAPSETFLHFYVKNNSPGNRLSKFNELDLKRGDMLSQLALCTNQVIL